MINDRPPRDGSPPSAEFHNVTAEDVTCDIYFTNRNEDATAGGDFPREGHSQSSSLTPQHGYPLSMDTNGLDPTYSSSEREAVDNTTQPTGSAFHETFRAFYDHPVLPLGSQSGLPETMEERSYAAITRLPRTPSIVPPRAALHISHSEDLGVYNLPGGPSDAAQLHTDSHPSLSSPQSNIHASSALDAYLPAVLDDAGVSSSTHNHNGRIDYHNHESPKLPAPVLDPLSSYIVSEDNGLGLHDKQHNPHRTPQDSRIDTRDGPGPSRFNLTASGGPPEHVRYLENGKRKASPDEGGGTPKRLPRKRRNVALEGFAPTQPIPPPTTTQRIKIEQPSYVCGNVQHNWVQQNPIDFTVDGQPGIRLTDALDPHFPGPDGRDDLMFQYAGAGSSVSCRLCFPGHLPRSSQITTADHRKAHNPITRKKLVFEVAKRVKHYVEVSKVGMRYENMILTKLVHVSKASWMPEIWFDQEPASGS